jgi:hypothetical protein
VAGNSGEGVNRCGHQTKMSIACIFSALLVGTLTAIVVGVLLTGWEKKQPLLKDFPSERVELRTSFLLRVMGCVFLVNVLLYIFVMHGR